MGWYVNASRVHLRKHLIEFAKDIGSDAVVLDAGAGRAPYNSHAKYETADFHKVNKRYSPSTYVCSIDNIPVEDGRYDFVILTQVLEHVPNPHEVIREAFRVLKPGGKIFCSCPLYFEEHEAPYDFYRYTQFSLKHIFEASGFSVEKFSWLEGYYATIAYTFMLITKHLPLNPTRYSPLLAGFLLLPVNLTVRTASVIFKGILSRLDLVCKITDSGHPINYVVVALKRA